MHATFDADSEYRVASVHCLFYLNENFLEMHVGSAYWKQWFPVARALPHPVGPPMQKHCIMLNSACAAMPLAK